MSALLTNCSTNGSNNHSASNNSSKRKFNFSSKSAFKYVCKAINSCDLSEDHLVEDSLKISSSLSPSIDDSPSSPQLQAAAAASHQSNTKQQLQQQQSAVDQLNDLNELMRLNEKCKKMTKRRRRIGSKRLSSKKSASASSSNAQDKYFKPIIGGDEQQYGCFTAFESDLNGGRSSIYQMFYENVNNFNEKVINDDDLYMKRLFELKSQLSCMRRLNLLTVSAETYESLAKSHASQCGLTNYVEQFVRGVFKKEKEADENLLLLNAWYEKQKTEMDDYERSEQVKAVQEYEESRRELKESLLKEYTEKRKRLEVESSLLEINYDISEVKPIMTRKLRRRPNDPNNNNTSIRGAAAISVSLSSSASLSALSVQQQ